MNSIKKTGIIVGALAGGSVGGGISLIGKLAKVKAVDDVGSSVVSSSILMGEFTGDIASGTVDAVSGKITKNPSRTKKGLNDLKGCGKKVVNNFVENVHYVADTGVEVARGVKAKDKNRVAKSAKKFAKWVAVGAITVGAIKMTDSDDEV
jgi:hypothetical protein